MGTKRSLGILRSAPGGKFHKNALLGFVVVVVGWFVLAPESSDIFLKKKKKNVSQKGRRRADENQCNAENRPRLKEPQRGKLTHK